MLGVPGHLEAWQHREKTEKDQRHQRRPAQNKRECDAALSLYQVLNVEKKMETRPEVRIPRVKSLVQLWPCLYQSDKSLSSSRNHDMGRKPFKMMDRPSLSCS